ncbi:uncharacterized protein SRS1_14245 [Sporisorium reilianum f. sp. reilianum]|uniref:Transcription factor TFIIIC triple barrel domain-containing protein n=1 Tax=Sporisorium reilianum f. sp. reilianum TaxID=72559 RepID=A0A2N8UFF8_9BASI|nr:uncharacterized protein SRS1_14245 [Sporisorium reilianum f. sp. reilianum]
MTIAPIIDASWHRLPGDSFGAGPSALTPLDGSSSMRTSTDESDGDDGSEWSFSDSEELVTLDLGTERIAKRALLGYSVGLDFVDADATSSASASSARSVRGFRGASHIDGTDTDKRTKRGADPAAARSTANAPHIAAGKQLSITGLDTPTPLLKINETVLRSTRMCMFGTEIVLRDHLDPTRARNRQHRLQPIPPSTSDGRANVNSTTTRRRILFKPIYDPAARETTASDAAALDRLRALAKPPAYVLAHEAKQPALEEQQRAASLANLMGSALQGETPQRGSAKGKYKRKEVSAEEQIVRAAERKIRKAAKLHLQEQQQRERQGEAAALPGEAVQESRRDDEAGNADGNSTEQQPPPSFDSNQP